MGKVEVVYLSEATREILEGMREQEEVSFRDIVTKALQAVGIVHAYNQEGKVFVALDGSTADILSVIEIPQVSRDDDQEVRSQEFFFHVSAEIYRGLTRVAVEMQCSREDVFRKGVMLYEAIRQYRSNGMRFGVTNKFSPRALYAELFLPGITVL